MSVQLDYLLNLPEVSVEICTQVEEKIVLTLCIIAEGIKCPHCQNHTEELHQNRPTLVRDLPTFGRAVYLKVPRRQYYCSHCQKYSTESLSFIDEKRRHTLTFGQKNRDMKITSMKEFSNLVWSK